MTASLAGAVGLHPTHHSGPWKRWHSLAVVAANALALVLAVVGWFYSSNKTHAADQIAWLNVSFAGVVLAIAANGFFLARGRQTVRLAMPVALAATNRSTSRYPTVASSNGSAPSHSVSPGAGRLVTVAGTRRYHRPECGLVAGKATQQATAGQFAGAGLVPCEVCSP